MKKFSTPNVIVASSGAGGAPNNGTLKIIRELHQDILQAFEV